MIELRKACLGASRSVCWAALLGAALVLSATSAAGQVSQVSASGRPADSGSPELAAPDPSVVMGRLPNGMRYALKQVTSGRTAILFHIGAGSLEEADSERGAAHFIEHMAFNGSRHFPPGSLIGRFESAGVAFGRDQNAATDPFGVTYRLNLPAATTEELDTGFA